MNLRRPLLLAGIFIAALGIAPSAALAGPVWSIHSMADTNAAPGSVITYRVLAMNLGDANAPKSTGGDENNCVPGSPPPSDPAKCYTVTASFPPELTPLSAGSEGGQKCSVQAATAICVFPGNADSDAVPAFGGSNIFKRLTFTAQLSPTASGVVSAAFEVAGGEAANVSTTVEPTVVDPAPASFGVDAFDVQSTADAAGTTSTQAGAHPYEFTTSLRFNTRTHAAPQVGPVYPVESTRDVVVDLPPGFVGNPTVVDRCRSGELASGTVIPLPKCTPESQIGTALIPEGNGMFGPIPVFNMAPPANAPARIGLNVAGTIVTLDATLRPDGDYALRTTAKNVPEFATQGTLLTLWGVPSDPVHDGRRTCPGKRYDSGLTCKSDKPLEPFLRNPTSCSAPGVGLLSTVSIDSWEHPGVWASASSRSHLPPGFPADPSDWGPEQGTEGCDQVPFDPELEGGPPAAARAGKPSAMSFDLSLTQTSDFDTIATSDVRKAVVTLPQGIRVSPSSADGLEGCSPGQIALRSSAKQTCPIGSRLGSVRIDTPLLAEPLKGGVYLATPFDNPFDSLIAVYLAVEGQGVNVKLPGEVEIDPSTGQVTATFAETPQTPFTNVHLEFEGGPRAALAMPSKCGTYEIHSQVTGWNGDVVDGTSSFTVDEGCDTGGFKPKLEAGTENPVAGKTANFHLRLTREDGTEEIGGLKVALPPGLVGHLKGLDYCSDAALASVSADTGTGARELAAPSCPASSRVGRVTVGAGAGSNPFYTTTGSAYLAGPYKGAPTSLAVIVPALAGPFDLGSVVVRNRIHVDPTSAQLTVESDPLPRILYGIPLDVRDIRVSIDRDRFILNPTNCDPMQIDASLTSTEGASAGASVPFQLTGCDRLRFKPRLSVKLKGGTKRSMNPALVAVMRPRAGNANAKRISVALPHSEFLAHYHIRTICTRVQFAADACPAASVYGKVSATSPILDYALRGKVYLRSSDNPLPDLVLALRGPANQPIRVDAVGRIDSKDGGIRTTFEGLPDTPLTKVVLRMPAGEKSLLENSTNICHGIHKATVQMDAHNGKIGDFRPTLQAECGKKSKKSKSR